MIFGIGTDIVKVSRFEKWLDSPGMIHRFFNPREHLALAENTDEEKHQAACQHYGARFAAKEAFSKALGTGLTGFSLNEVYVQKDSLGKPEIILEGRARQIFEGRAGRDAVIHLSLTHEKEYAVAFVIIERG